MAQWLRNINRRPQIKAVRARQHSGQGFRSPLANLAERMQLWRQPQLQAEGRLDGVHPPLEEGVITNAVHLQRDLPQHAARVTIRPKSRVGRPVRSRQPASPLTHLQELRSSRRLHSGAG